jgi:hypothetical protein
MVKKKWWVRKIAQTLEMNGLVEKAKADRTVGLIFPMPTRLCIESWSPLGFIQWSGEVELYFSSALHTPFTNMIGLRLQKQSYSSA